MMKKKGSVKKKGRKRSRKYVHKSRTELINNRKRGDAGQKRRMDSYETGREVL